HQGIAMPRRIARKHPDLTILDLAECPTILPRDPHGVLALFDKARLIKHEDPVRLPQRLGYELMVIPQHLLLIPVDLTDKPLQPANSPSSTWRAMGSIDLRSSWLNWPTM